MSKVPPNRRLASTIVLICPIRIRFCPLRRKRLRRMGILMLAIMVLLSCIVVCVQHIILKLNLWRLGNLTIHDSTHVRVIKGWHNRRIVLGWCRCIDTGGGLVRRTDTRVGCERDRNILMGEVLGLVIGSIALQWLRVLELHCGLWDLHTHLWRCVVW